MRPKNLGEVLRAELDSLRQHIREGINAEALARNSGIGSNLMRRDRDVRVAQFEAFGHASVGAKCGRWGESRLTTMATMAEAARQTPIAAG